jgi:ABC-type multidrug transport system fused ATPase/permease subunit
LSFNLRGVRRIYGTFGHLLKAYWKWFALGYGGLLGTILLHLARPWPLKLILDYVLVDRPLPAGAAGLVALVGDSAYALLTVCCVFMVLLVVLEGICSYVSKYSFAAAGHRMTNDVRQHVFYHLQVLPHAYHAASRSGDLVVRLTSDITCLRKLLITSLQDLAKYFLTFLGIVITLLLMDWQLTLLALAVVPVLYAMTFRFSGSIAEVAQTKRRRESDVASIVQETMTSMAVVQAFGQEAQEKQRLAKESDASLEADLRKARLAGTYRRAVQVLVAVGSAAVIWFGASRALSGELLPGDLIVFAAYLKNLYSPIGGFSDLVMEFAGNVVSGERIVEILEADVAVGDEPDAVPAPRLKGEVSFQGVTFGYRPGEPVLREVDFTVAPGRMVALVGSSGTGKSTLVSLLLRFYDPWEGRVLFDGADVRSFKVKSVREQMSVVLQEPILFRRSVRENIAYGKSGSTFDEVVQAAKAAQAHEFIERLPRGYETVCSERGLSLSGGERQRIAIARALLRDTPILILDEPASGIDAITEAELNTTLNTLMQGRTAFVIAHRLPTIKRADLILLIEEGRITGQGTHAELLERSSHYRELYALQDAPGGLYPDAPGS